MGPEPSVLASARLPGAAFANFEAGRVERTDLSAPEAIGPRPDVLALAVFGETVDDAVLDRLPNLRIVANFGVGYDNIDVEACAGRAVAVTNTPGVVDGATADLAIALMLACRRRVVEGDALIRRGLWEESSAADPVPGNDFHRSTLGVIGCGRIGREVARRAAAFDHSLLYTQRRRLEESTERELGLAYRPLEALLGEADIVTIHCPLTPRTEGLLGREELARMPDGACLINTARGGIVDEPALVEELVSGRLKAGLDVFAHEPSVPPELLELPNVVLSPHAGTATAETRTAMSRVVVDNIRAALAGAAPITPVPAPS